MSQPVVLIAEELSPATIDALGPDFDIRTVDGADRPALLAAIGDADAILIRSATKVDAEAIAAASNLKVVARAGVGLDNVDIKAATAAGVMVVNAPTSNIISAAELTVGHILSLARHIPAAHASLAAGAWKRSVPPSGSLATSCIAKAWPSTSRRVAIGATVGAALPGSTFSVTVCSMVLTPSVASSRMPL